MTENVLQPVHRLLFCHFSVAGADIDWARCKPRVPVKPIPRALGPSGHYLREGSTANLEASMTRSRTSRTTNICVCETRENSSDQEKTILQLSASGGGSAGDEYSSPSDQVPGFARRCGACHRCAVGRAAGSPSSAFRSISSLSLASSRAEAAQPGQ